MRRPAIEPQPGSPADGGAVRFEQVSFSYGSGGPRLSDVSLHISPGELVVLTGPSGSGKTTLTRLVNGLLPGFSSGELSGRVLLHGQNLAELAAWERGELIGSVFQDPRSQFFSTEVAGEIAFGCENYGLSHEEIVDRVHAAARWLRIGDLLDARLRDLSYGMRQKVALASAHAIDPDVYLLDEPTANLDRAGTDQLHRLIADLKRQGKTILVAEHRLDYLMDLADRVIYLEDGRIARTFTPHQLQRLPIDERIGLGLRAPRLPAVRPRRETAGNARTPRHSAVEARGIVKSFGKSNTLDGIDLTIHAGEIIAVVGPNGAGKSVLGRVLSGLVKNDRGTLAFAGEPARRKRRRGRAWYIGQDLDSQLFGESVIDELTTGQPHTDEVRTRAEDILDDLGLTELADRHPATLSGGQKQRLVLGVALMNDAGVLVLDEPTSGLDGRTMRSVSATLRRLAEQQGRAIVLITHDAECVLECCERVVRIEHGRVTRDERITDATTLLGIMG